MQEFGFYHRHVTFPIIDIPPQIIPATHPQLSYLSVSPAGPPVARLIVLHGYGDHAGRYSHFLQWMAERGIACHALDFRGHGRSAGKPGAILRWDEYLDDLTHLLAIKELADPSPPLFVLGHSHGGLIAAAAAMRGLLNQARGIILVAPYLQLKMPVPIGKRVMAAVASHLHPTLAIKSGLDGSMLTRDQQMVDDGKNDPYVPGIATPRWFTETNRVQSQVRGAANQFNLPLLLLLPGNDTVADVRASMDFFDTCSSADKTIKHYPDNRHELLREIDRMTTFTNISEWMNARSSPISATVMRDK